MDPLQAILPKVTFQCKGRSEGYYADADFDCEVFHYCKTSGFRFTFVCPKGSKFNQRQMTCDYEAKDNVCAKGGAVVKKRKDDGPVLLQQQESSSSTSTTTTATEAESSTTTADPLHLFTHFFPPSASLPSLTPQSSSSSSGFSPESSHATLVDDSEQLLLLPATATAQDEQKRGNPVQPSITASSSPSSSSSSSPSISGSNRLDDQQQGSSRWPDSDTQSQESHARPVIRDGDNDDEDREENNKKDDRQRKEGGNRSYHRSAVSAGMRSSNSLSHAHPFDERLTTKSSLTISSTGDYGDSEPAVVYWNASNLADPTTTSADGKGKHGQDGSSTTLEDDGDKRFGEKIHNQSSSSQLYDAYYLFTGPSPVAGSRYVSAANTPKAATTTPMPPIIITAASVPSQEPQPVYSPEVESAPSVHRHQQHHYPDNEEDGRQDEGSRPSTTTTTTTTPSTPSWMAAFFSTSAPEAASSPAGVRTQFTLMPPYSYRRPERNLTSSPQSPASSAHQDGSSFFFASRLTTPTPFESPSEAEKTTTVTAAPATTPAPRVPAPAVGAGEFRPGIRFTMIEQPGSSLLLMKVGRSRGR